MSLALALMMGLSVYAADAVDDGWKSDNNGWYYMSNGVSLKGCWIKDVDGKWYYVDNSGYMHTGWLCDADNHWYFMNRSDGSLATGLCSIDGKLYYFSPLSGGPLGAMITGQQVIDGVSYYFDPVTGEGIPDRNGIGMYSAGISLETVINIAEETLAAENSFEEAFYTFEALLEMDSENSIIRYARSCQNSFLNVHNHLNNAIIYCADYPETAQIKRLLQNCDSLIASDGLYSPIGNEGDSYVKALLFTVNANDLLFETDFMPMLEQALYQITDVLESLY